MAIPISFNRPKLSTTNNVSESVEVGTAITNSNYAELRVFLDDLTVDTYTLSDLTNVSWTTGSGTISGQAGDFSTVRIGDVVTSTSGTDFANTQLVTAVASDGSSVDVSPNPDGIADVGQAGSDLIFTPGDIDSTLYYIRLFHTVSGTTLTVTPTISCQDGSRVAEGSANDGSDAELVTYDDGVVKTLPSVTINLDNYLTNARVAKLN